MWENDGPLKSSLHSLRARGQGFDFRSGFLFFWWRVPFFCSSLFVRHRGVCGFTTAVYLDPIDYNYTVHWCSTYEYTRMYLYIPAMYFCCCCCSVCCYTAVAAAAVLLLAAAVRPRVPDDKICCCGTLHLIPVFSFLFIQTRCIFNVTLGSTL